MITKQYSKALTLKMIGGSAAVTVKDVTGTDRSLTYTSAACHDAFGHYYATMTSALDTSAARGVGFVYGGSEPTEDDYKSDGTLVSGLTVTSAEVGSDDDEGVSTSCTYTIVNTNTSDVTIDEVCFIACVFYASSKAYRVLADRTKLENPVTIPAGGVGQITYTMRANYMVK